MNSGDVEGLLSGRQHFTSLKGNGTLHVFVQFWSVGSPFDSSLMRGMVRSQFWCWHSTRKVILLSHGLGQSNIPCHLAWPCLHTEWQSTPKVSAILSPTMQIPALLPEEWHNHFLESISQYNKVITEPDINLVWLLCLLPHYDVFWDLHPWMQTWRHCSGIQSISHNQLAYYDSITGAGCRIRSSIV